MKPILKALCAATTVAMVAACSSSNDGAATTPDPTADAVTDTGTDPVRDPATDPLVTSWQLKLAGRYARVTETRTTTPVAVWPAPGLLDTSGGPTAPAYGDIQQVSLNDDWVQISTSGLASHPMGPWYWNAETLFGNWPRAQGSNFRFPRRPLAKADAEVVAIGLGPQGAWVNGVAFFNQLDGAYYNTAAGREMQEGPGDGTSNFGAAADKIWIRDAIPVEGPTFDASNAHQPPIGQYHYHSNPLALRFQLGDNVRWSAAGGRYVEAGAPFHHSPILGWARDGYPIYGPYGYADCAATAAGTDAEVRRMRSGYVLRDGRQGTTDLRSDGRKSLGRWAAFLHQLPTGTVDGQGRVALEASQYGPDISTRYYLGRYNEDWEFLADLGQRQGQGFDLDIHNGRECRTPDYPDGTYAYYVTINEDGSAAYPYTVGRQVRGDPVGGRVTATTVSEPLTVHAVSTVGQEPAPEIRREGSTRVVSWPGAEGAQYTVTASVDGGQTWTGVASNVATPLPGSDPTPGGTGFFAAEPLTVAVVDAASYASEPVYRVQRSAIGRFDNGPVGATKGQIVAVSPATIDRGQTVRLTVTLNGNQPIVDIDPDSSVRPAAFELVSLDGSTVIASGSNLVRNLQQTSADLAIPADTPTGDYMVRMTFMGMGGSVFRSVDQLAGVAAEAVAPSPAVYPDLPITVR